MISHNVTRQQAAGTKAKNYSQCKLTISRDTGPNQYKRNNHYPEGTPDLLMTQVFSVHALYAIYCL